MSRTLGYVLFFLAFTSVVYSARTNLCLANTGTSQPYTPLQLFPADCPNNASNCMAAVYNYSAPDYMWKGPKTLKPNNRESWVYMTQDESDNIDVVIITATTYTNNIIKTIVEVDGAETGTVQTLVRDDPDEDQWYWNPATNRGNFTWLLQPTYTDGVVLGHFKFIDNYCFRVEFLPNWGGAISTIVFLSGTVAKPVRVIAKPLVGNSTYSTFFEFCQYPKAVITKTDASCTALGTASASSLNGTATYLWTDSTGATISTSSSVTGLQAGTYTVSVTVNGCSAVRPVTIGFAGVPVSATYTVTSPTKTTQGKITLTVSGGNPPYTITWKNSAGTVIASNVNTVNVAAGTYTAIVTDGCSTWTEDIVVSAPGSCPAGTYVDPDGTGCIGCPAGTYSEAADSDFCNVCPPGTWNTAVNATSCNQCGANTYSGGATGPCTSCPVSTTSAAGSGTCTPCPVGTQRASTATSCTACPAGTYRCADNGLCTSCPAGSFATSGAQTCESCDAGTFAASGATTCSSCATNTYAASGAGSCTACPSGKTAPAKSTVLLACI